MIARILCVVCLLGVVASSSRLVDEAKGILNNAGMEVKTRIVQGAREQAKQYLISTLVGGMMAVAKDLEAVGGSADKFLGLALTTVAHYIEPEDPKDQLGLSLDDVTAAVRAQEAEVDQIYDDIHLGAAFMRKVSGSYLDYMTRIKAADSDPANKVDLTRFTMNAVDELSTEADEYFSPSNVAEMVDRSLQRSPPAAALAYQRVVSARLQYFTLQHAALNMEHGKETGLAKLEVDRLHQDAKAYNSSAVASGVPINVDYTRFDPENPEIDTPGGIVMVLDGKKMCLVGTADSDQTVAVAPYRMCQHLWRHHVADAFGDQISATWEQLSDGRVRMVGSDLCLNFEWGWCNNLIVWPCAYDGDTIPNNMKFGIKDGKPWAGACSDFPISTPHASWIPVQVAGAADTVSLLALGQGTARNATWLRMRARALSGQLGQPRRLAATTLRMVRVQFHSVLVLTVIVAFAAAILAVRQAPEPPAAGEPLLG